jgi:hypothetical protein
VPRQLIRAQLAHKKLTKKPKQGTRARQAAKVNEQSQHRATIIPAITGTARNSRDIASRVTRVQMMLGATMQEMRKKVIGMLNVSTL